MVALARLGLLELQTVAFIFNQHEIKLAALEIGAGNSDNDFVAQAE